MLGRPGYQVRMTYQIQTRKLTPQEGDGWLAEVSELAGCMGDGNTESEAIKDAKLAIAEWLDEASDLGRDIPTK